MHSHLPGRDILWNASGGLSKSMLHDLKYLLSDPTNILLHIWKPLYQSTDMNTGKRWSKSWQNYRMQYVVWMQEHYSAILKCYRTQHLKDRDIADSRGKV